MNLLLDHLVQIVGVTVKRTQSCNLDARLTTMTREVVAVGVVCGVEVRVVCGVGVRVVCGVVYGVG